MTDAALITSFIWEGRVEDARKLCPNLSEGGWNSLLTMQPEGSNNKYLKWCARELQKAGVEVNGEHERIEEIIGSLVNFVKRFPDKDIYSLSWGEVREALASPEAKSKKARVKEALPVVLETDRWKVFKPQTHEAMQKIGGGTEWCVATSNDNHWLSYSSVGEFLVLKLKEEADNYFAGSRFALYCDGATSGPGVGLQVYESNDTHLLTSEFLEDVLLDDQVQAYIKEWVEDVPYEGGFGTQEEEDEEPEEEPDNTEEEDDELLSSYASHFDEGPYDFCALYARTIVRPEAGGFTYGFTWELPNRQEFARRVRTLPEEVREMLATAAYMCLGGDVDALRAGDSTMAQRQPGFETFIDTIKPIEKENITKVVSHLFKPELDGQPDPQVESIINELITEGRVEQARKKYPLTPQIWDAIIADQPPNSNNKYLMWIGKVTSAHEPGAWVSEATRALQTVLSFAHKAPNTDIYQFSSVDAAIDFLNHREPKPVSKKQRLKQEAGVVWENDEWKVFAPKTHEAMQKVGGGTSWCVATSNPTHWNNYSRDGFFLVAKAKVYMEAGAPTPEPDDMPTVNRAPYGYTLNKADMAILPGERFAIYTDGGELQVYNEEDTNIGWSEFRKLAGKNSEIVDYVKNWESDIEYELEDRRNEAESRAIDEYVENPREGPFDFLNHFAEDKLNIDLGYSSSFGSKFDDLTPDQQSLIRLAALRSSTVEPDSHGRPSAFIETGTWGRYEEYIKHEVSEEDLQALEDIVYKITGLSAIDRVFDDPDQIKKVRGTTRHADDIVRTAGERIQQKADAMKGQPQLFPDVAPSDGREVNRASLRRQLQRDGYDDIASALESKIDVDSDQLIAILLEGL